jgi:hypothetical protein
MPLSVSYHVHSICEAALCTRCRRARGPERALARRHWRGLSLMSRRPCAPHLSQSLYHVRASACCVRLSAWGRTLTRDGADGMDMRTDKGLAGHSVPRGS